jgi:hypothetical protein
MFAEPPLWICGTAADAMLSINNIATFFPYVMNGVISVHIHSNLVKIPTLKFANLIDNFLIRLALQLKFLMTMLTVHGLMVKY